MKKVINKLPLFAIAFSLVTANTALAKTSVEIQVKSKSVQAEVSRKHRANWNQVTYKPHVKLFKCRDSWGHKLHGKFTRDQQYYIELGGGSCRVLGRVANNSQFYQSFRPYNVHYNDWAQALDQVKYQYGLANARLVEADNISASRKSLKYTLVFKTSRYGYREFRVKLNRKNGHVKAIYEV